VSALTGTFTLLRSGARRDRVSMAVWVSLLALMVMSTAKRYRELFSDDTVRHTFVTTMSANRGMTAFAGGIPAPTIGGLLVMKLGTTMFLTTSLLAMFMVVRHTRAEEESGRHELTAATVVGRQASLTAALLQAWGFSLAIGLSTTLALLAKHLEPGGALAFGLAVAAPGFVFAAIAAVAAQLFATARAANALSGALLGATVALRMAADASGRRGMRWLAPDGWSHNVESFGANRLAALVVPVLVTAVLTAIAYTLSARRDVGSGMFAPAAGPPAAPTLRGPFALAWRLQRGMFAGWTIASVAYSALVASILPSIPALAHTNGNPMTRVLARYATHGAMPDPVAAYLWLATIMFAQVLALYPVLAVLRLRHEERAGNAELVLSASVTRERWMLSHVTVALMGTFVMGIANGLVTAAMVRHLLPDATNLSFTKVLLAHVIQVPAMWTLGGIAALVFGAMPTASIALGWGAFVLVNVFGTILGPALGMENEAADKFVPFHYLPRILTGETMALAPIAALVVISGALVASGVVAFRRRDLAY
jgi:ABC-2 type transport system permease protein